ncbi:hypothetical protein Pmani_013686 [Petrolisthes manimaculis]|uniref:Protein-tyrosine-phosphatase n=1 Tax=Petrolisthes manimaculis TaxID=1843537 RepID=A0AAE1PXV1_9EUCA|nr:hypothetical protein Pmani_013686 [Petrolisthes manimaculis]
MRLPSPPHTSTHHFTPCTALLILMAVTFRGTAGQGKCKRFADLADGESYTCSNMCVNQSDFKMKDVFGTDYYTEDSDVCVAAVHAGKLWEEGGAVEITRLNEAITINGTLRNRIMSKSRDDVESPVFSFSDMAPRHVPDLAADVVIVHNSYSGDTLNLICIAEDSNRNLSENDILRWNYDVDETKSKDVKETGVHIEVPIIDNARVYRCRGRSAATDVLAVIQRPDQLYTAAASTFRSSQGETMSINVTKNNEDLPSTVFIRRLPDDWTYRSFAAPDKTLPFTLENVTQADAGIYVLGNGKNGNHFTPYIKDKDAGGKGAYFHLTVQDCTPGKYGTKCEEWCPDCENGGLCHPQTGSCLCAPGFQGTTCQNACEKGYFGSSCALQCNETSLFFSPPTEKSCFGLTMCLPEPYGCSCPAGYWGPFCKETCSKGWYGAGCLQKCDHCIDQNCDRNSGWCPKGCVNGIPCDDQGRTLDLPRLRSPPTINNITETSAHLSFPLWKSEVDDGGSDDFEITGYDIQIWSEVNNTWTTWRHLSLTSITSSSATIEVKVDDLFPGYQYAVKVLVQTQSGAADGSSNKRVHNSTFTTSCTGPGVFDLKVTDITNQSANLQWRGKHSRCGFEPFDVLVQLDDGSLIYNDSSNVPHLNLTDLKPHLNYSVVITDKSSNPEKSLSFSTASYAPASPTLDTEDDQWGTTTLNVSWTLPPESYKADIYRVTYKVLQHKACSIDATSSPKESRNVTDLIIMLENLHSYTTYNVCVEAINDGGTSEPTCQQMDTLPSVPNVTVSGGLKCWSNETMECEAILSSGCKEQNGPNFEIIINIQTFLECNNSFFHYEVPMRTVNERATFSFSSGLLHGWKYKAKVYIRNAQGIGQIFTTKFTTEGNSPEKVRNLTGVAQSPTSVLVQWNDPCPPNGIITKVAYRCGCMEHQGQWIEQSASNSSCTPSTNYDRCVEIDGLTPNTNYSIHVKTGTEVGFGPETELPFIFQEKKPGKPSLASVIHGEDSLELKLQLPEETGGILINCTTTIPLHNIKSNVSVTQGKTDVSIQLKKLNHSQMYNLQMYCCNSALCGDFLEEGIATRLLVTPELQGKLKVADRTDADITLILPSFNLERKVNRSLVVMVQRVSSEDLKFVHKNFTAEFLRLHNAQYSEKRMKREAAIQKEAKMEDTYIAAIISKDLPLKTFVVGDGQWWGDYHNFPLTINQPYMVAIVAQTQLQEEEHYSEKRLDAVVTLSADADWIQLILGIIVFILCILICVGLIWYYQKRMQQPDCKENKLLGTYNQEDETVELFHNNEVQEDQSPCVAPTTVAVIPSPQAPQAVVRQPEAVYEVNIPNHKEENIYENLQLNSRVPKNQLEAYLNKIISSLDTMQEFLSVAPNVGKSQSDGELPENKKKNRYRNNLPYNETRVKLSLISTQDTDKNSDYINANHVHGFGGSLQYIAAQGPKDSNKPTIGDFWRMVMEQNVTAIIMVANFVEGGKSKVGAYLKLGEKLEVEDITVKVLKTDTHSNHHVSRIQVVKNERSHTLTHYHYTSWPDHGVPTESHSLATMIRYIIDSHSQGTVVVHCSAGIGRTGTVLFVMLMYEMLMVHGGVDPLEVLQRLRDCRARLVENVVQYNLGLRVFDELLYGNIRSISRDNLDGQLKEQMSQSHKLYQRVAAFPSGLSYRAASYPKYSALNRNTNILPADGRHIFLEIENGDPISQYINAIHLDGLNNPSKMIVTEHPLPATHEKFWRMVVEQKCASIVLINYYNGYESEFPQIVSEKNKDTTVGQFIIRTNDITNRDSLIIYTIKISSKKAQDVHQKVSVYQIMGWPYGKQLPASPKVLVAVSEMVLVDYRKPEAGPVLLCCGNGVTGCGLMSGVLLVIEKLQEQQIVDVYRTMVHLRRVRPQFITSQKQFDLLYDAAAMYVKNYSTYVNL